MKKIFLTAISMVMCSVSFAAQVSLEEPGFSPLPRAVTAALFHQSATDLNDPPCKLEGKPFSLSAKSKREDFIVTTVDGCAWGNAAGPIWLMHKAGNRYVMVLEASGMWVKSSSTSSHGLYNIELSTETAGASSRERWRFNGATYKYVWGEARMLGEVVAASARR